ncbi:hypothetical protein [Nocardiopsis sp. NRRL B-16309]|uniref:hypothetical protein n=1 Tax=Nocardiopsis sp. NRRL B-16309 TaxID=1519494 RepID=UPI0018D1C341|nr:hypothetical protein [Nocardiopsis sp. NRRL B-16309]
MLQELIRMSDTDRSVEPSEREREERRLGARRLRASQRAERRLEEGLMEIAWSRLC